MTSRVVLSFAVAAAVILPLRAADSDRSPGFSMLDRSLEPGVRISVKGRLLEDGTFRGEEIELERSGDRDEELRGPITELDREQRTFVVVGRRVRVRSTTEFSEESDRSTTFDDLVEGLRIKVDGDTDEQGRLAADKIRIYRDSAPRARLEIEGLIERLEPSATGVATLHVAGVAVQLTLATELVGRRGELRPIVRRLGGIPDDEELLFVRDTRLGRYVAIAGEVRLRGEWLSNLDLDEETDDTELLPQITGRLGVAARLGPGYAYATVVGAREFVIQGEESFTSGDSALLIGEAYLQFPVSSNVSIAAGRQRINDEREWWFNTRTLDAIRIFGQFPLLRLEASISRDIFDENRNIRDRQLRNVILSASYRVARGIDLEAYYVDRHDLEAYGDSPRTLGIRALGEIGRHIDFWADLAYQGGTTCDHVIRSDTGDLFDTGRRCNRTEPDGEFVVRDVRSHAIDLGLVYRPRIALDPSFIVAYAVGSGEDDTIRELDLTEASELTATSFRQTGLQRNRWNFNGVVNFQYYGEVMDPELFNIRISTLGIGLRPRRRISIDVIHHRFRQDKASKSFHEFEIGDTPSGVDPDLGQEWDVAFGYEPSRSFELRLTGGVFLPGAAMDADAGTASVVQFQSRFRF